MKKRSKSKKSLKYAGKAKPKAAKSIKKTPLKAKLKKSTAKKKVPTQAVALVNNTQKPYKLLEDNLQWTNRIEIVGSTGNLYIVAQRKASGVWACSCFGYRRNQNCKHLLTMVPLLEAAPKKRSLT